MNISLVSEKHCINLQVKENHAKLSLDSTDDSFRVLCATRNFDQTVKNTYASVHEALLQANEDEPIFLNDFLPDDRRRRYDFVKNITTPCNSVLFTRTGSGLQHLHFLWRVCDLKTDIDLISEAHNIVKGLENTFPVYHSRAMRQDFVTSFGRAIGCKSAFLRAAYRRLTGDSSAASTATEAEVDQRVSRILDDEDPDLIWDLRTNNPGRPEQYKKFLEQCQKYINASVETAVDDRRHDVVDGGDEVVTHLATALSAVDLHRQVSSQCPEGTAIPSVQWLRNQFWPRRPTAKSASRYTGRLRIKFMVQARQLRANHIDAYYASALFRYEKEFAVKFREHLAFASLDDKHTIKVGEPQFPVAAVERGKEVLVSKDKKLVVSDHDFTRLSLTPSVAMIIDVPESIEGSFYRGRVFVLLKENAFNPSSPRRHMAELKGILQELGPVKPVLLLYTDGGPDHRLTYISVQLTLMSLWLNLDLDFLCAIRTPPQHSWKNPVERIMSIINLALQGVGVMREEVVHESELKRCGSLKSIRDMAEKIPELKEEVLRSVEPTVELLSTLIQRLKLKEHNFESHDAASEEDIDVLWEEVLKVGPCLVLIYSSVMCLCEPLAK